jgi:hypothetical protein
LAEAVNSVLTSPPPALLINSTNFFWGSN